MCPILFKNNLGVCYKKFRSGIKSFALVQHLSSVQKNLVLSIFHGWCSYNFLQAGLYVQPVPWKMRLEIVIGMKIEILIGIMKLLF